MKSLFVQSVLVLFFSFLGIGLSAQDLKVIVDLEGSWKFSIGDDPAWAATDYNDKDWDMVSVPRSWENNGFADYNGFAWYRKGFQVPGDIHDRSAILMLGQIDDVDEVYLNGQMIGASGQMPPVVITAHRQQRRYPLPAELLNPNKTNVIAVRVFDEYGEGGIYVGPVGIYSDRNEELLSLNLAGLWEFEPFIKTESYNQALVKNNGKIRVPGYWEYAGYPELDGTATYSRSFELTPDILEEDLMIVLGYIDDLDKVYINDVRVGAQEYIDQDFQPVKHKDLIFRAYKIPLGTLKVDDTNFIEVQVTDTGGLGGIYKGPVGLITRQNFELLKKEETDKSWNMWDGFLKDVFEWD